MYLNIYLFTYKPLNIWIKSQTRIIVFEKHIPIGAYFLL